MKNRFLDQGKLSDDAFGDKSMSDVKKYKRKGDDISLKGVGIFIIFGLTVIISYFLFTELYFVIQ